MFTRRKMYGMRAYDWTVGWLGHRTGRSFLVWPDVFKQGYSDAERTKVFRSLLRVGPSDGKDLYLLIQDVSIFNEWWQGMAIKYGYETWFKRACAAPGLGLYVIAKRQKDLEALEEAAKIQPCAWTHVVVHAFPQEAMDLYAVDRIDSLRIGGSGCWEESTMQPMEIDWILHLRTQAQYRGTPFTFIGWAGWTLLSEHPSAEGKTKVLNGKTYVRTGPKWFRPTLEGEFEEEIPDWLEAYPINRLGPKIQAKRSTK